MRELAKLLQLCMPSQTNTAIVTNTTKPKEAEKITRPSDSYYTWYKCNTRKSEP